ncbi:hypothetical protein D9M68_508080 [compost metagenome]
MVGDLPQEGLQRAALLHADGVFVERLGEGDAAAPRKAVLARGDEHQPVGAEVDGVQAQRVHLARDDADVGAPVAHAARDLSIRFFLKVDVDARVGGQEAGQDFGQEVGHRRGVGEHAQVAAQAAAVLEQVGAQLVGLVQHQPGVVQEGLARRQQAHAAGLALQQLQAGLGLERLDARAGRGQRQVLALGRPREVAEFGRGHEQAQVGEVEEHGAMVVKPSEFQKPGFRNRRLRRRGGQKTMRPWRHTTPPPPCGFAPRR